MKTIINTDPLFALQCNALTVDHLSILTGWSPSYIYKLTSGNKLPYYKPMGKTIFFKKDEIEAFLLTNRHATQLEISERAADYVNFKNQAA